MSLLGALRRREDQLVCGYRVMLLVLAGLLVAACSPPPLHAPAGGPVVARTREQDGAQVLLVPAGGFMMGSDAADVRAYADEIPAHFVYLDAFWIDRTEVSNAQYVQFLNALGDYRGACFGRDCLETSREDADSHISRRTGRYLVDDQYADHPVTEVSWFGAEAYCNWVGAKLPTEAQWEKAARSTDGRLFPWGDGEPSCTLAQFAGCPGTTVPVWSNQEGASACGALNMAGNVWEWVADWYDPAYYQVSPTANPAGPALGDGR